VVEVLKATVSRTRPDGSDDDSFPSGHTSRSFAAATTLYVRQGGEIGIPALAVAGLVGVGRVEGDKHYWGDVVAGAVIGAGAGLLITDEPPESTDVSIQPWLTRDGGGLLAIVRF
jgi:membrane-associated phospholipid phosphatase